MKSFKQITEKNETAWDAIIVSVQGFGDMPVAKAKQMALSTINVLLQEAKSGNWGKVASLAKSGNLLQLANAIYNEESEF